MPLGTEVNVGSGDLVLDGVTAPPKRGTAPVFGSCLLWPNGWIDEDATWYGSRPRPDHIVLDRVPALHKRGTSAPLFSAHVYCGHGCPNQLLLSSCCISQCNPFDQNNLHRYISTYIIQLKR